MAEFCIKDMDCNGDCAYNHQCVSSGTTYTYIPYFLCVSVRKYVFIIILYPVAKGGRMRNVEMAPSLSPTCYAYRSYVSFYVFHARANSSSQSYIVIFVRYVKYLRTIKNCASNDKINYTNTGSTTQILTMYFTLNYVYSCVHLTQQI